MLKITRLPDKPALGKKNGSRLVSNKNNDSKQTFGKNNSNNKVDRFGVGKNGMEHTKKSRKLSKSGNSKSKKISKSQNLANLGKKLSKSGNLTNFNTSKARPKFLTLNTRTILNCL